MSAVLIMAGGKSSRMRASLGNRHKALVPILGVPMLERNLTWLIALGFRKLYLAAAAGECALLEFVRTRCQSLAAGFGATLSLIVETSPLGTIGACRLCVAHGDLIVVNVDNLTCLDLHGMLDTHHGSSAAMTIATHCQSFRMPFGQVVLEEQQIVDLLEKPETRYQISSGTYVLSARACQVIPPDRCIGAHELFYQLKANGEKIVAFPHNSLWIDVNDTDATHQAEALIAKHFKDFECPWPQTDAERVVVLLAQGTQILVNVSRGESLPGIVIKRCMTPQAAAQSCSPRVRFIATFDEPQPDGHVTRFHLFLAEHSVNAQAHVLWRSTDEVTTRTMLGLNRCLAYWRRHDRDEACA